MCLLAPDESRADADIVHLVAAALDRERWPTDETDGDGATRETLSFGWSEPAQAHMRRNLARLDRAAATGKIPKGGCAYLSSRLAKHTTPKAFADAYVKNMILVRDYFDDRRDGDGAERDAWLIVQHADHDRSLQRDVLRRMERSPGTGAAARWQYAYLWDRVAVGEKRPQRYGTQMECKNGARTPQFGLEDPERVDERRKEMGMAALADYAASFGPCQN